MSIYSFIFTIILFLIAIEIIAYTYINSPESNESSNEVQTILEQHSQQQRQQQRQQQQVAPILTPKQQRQNKNQKLRLENQNFHEKQKLYEKQQQELRQSIQKYDNTTLEERIKTSIKIQSMGISKEEYTLDEIPPWSQIISNFNSVTKANNDSNDDENDNDEPVILGLNEYCEDHRNKYKHENNIATGPAGMFSTGTNLIAILMKTNCRSPSTERTRARGFNLIQVPVRYVKIELN
jgi:exonuclease VII large subunit